MQKSTLLILSLFACSGLAQTLNWSHVADVHSQVATTGINPSSARFPDGGIALTYAVSDTLHIARLEADGSPTSLATTAKRCGEFTNLLMTASGQAAVVFETQDFPKKFRIFQSDAQSNIVRDAELLLPAGSTAYLQHLMESGPDLLLTMFRGNNHYLYRIETDNSLTQLYTAGVASTAKEDFVVTGEGNFIFRFDHSDHFIRSISPQGVIIWEENIVNGPGLLLDYRIAIDGNTLYALCMQREWIGGSPVDTYYFNQFDAALGDLVAQFEVTDAGCISALNDFKINPADGKLYASIRKCNDEVELLRIDPETLSVDGSTSFAQLYDTLNIADESFLHITASGQVVSIVKSFADDNEHGNLYVRALDKNLNAAATLEVNLDPPSGSEHVTHVLAYDDSHLLISGIVPDSDPFIFWEAVQYFWAMVELPALSVAEMQKPGLLVYPNPTSGKITIGNASGTEKFMIVNSVGQTVISGKMSGKDTTEIDVSALASGLYLLRADGKPAVRFLRE